MPHRSLRRQLAHATTAVAILTTAVGGQSAHPTFAVTVTGRGRPIVLIPGLLSSGEVWSSTVERYKDKYALHVLTLAGFGGPPPVGTPLLSRVRDEAIRYMREQTLDKPIVIGHSLGGFLAFWIAATAPDLVGGVVAVDGVPFLPALSNPSATAESMRAQADQNAIALRDAESIENSPVFLCVSGRRREFSAFSQAVQRFVTACSIATLTTSQRSAHDFLRPPRHHGGQEENP